MADRSGRTPLGTVTRHPLDWFADYAYVASLYVYNPTVGAGSIWQTVYFYNGDQNGRVARVYAAALINDGGGGYTVFSQQGFKGTKVGQAQSLRLDAAPANFFVYNQFQQTPIGPIINPFNAALGPVWGSLPQDGFDGCFITSDFPLYIIPAGYSLVLTNIDSSFLINTSIWFQFAAK